MGDPLVVVLPLPPQMPSYMFLFFFFGSYIVMVRYYLWMYENASIEETQNSAQLHSRPRSSFPQYLAFAYVYLLEPVGCISKVNHFLHALWFSVHTSATIGYGHM